MTPDTVAAVKAFMDAADARDYARVRETLTTDFAWFGTRGGVDQDQVVRGPDAAIEYIREIADTWERFEVDIEETVELGDVVLAYLRERGTVRHAELEVESTTAVVFVVRGGLLAEATGYLDRDEAREAATRRASE